MLSWFKLKKNVLAIGQEWRLKLHTDDPWAKPHDPVTIVDIKNGWVKYDMSLFKGQIESQTARIPTFLRLYEKVEEVV